MDQIEANREKVGVNASVNVLSLLLYYICECSTYGTSSGKHTTHSSSSRTTRYIGKRADRNKKKQETKSAGRKRLKHVLTQTNKTVFFCVAENGNSHSLAATLQYEVYTRRY